MTGGKKKSVVVVCGQEIAWSYIRRLRLTWFGGDWLRTIDAFWKARDARGPRGIIKYIEAGLLPDTDGNRYTLMPSAELERGEAGRQRLFAWWEQFYKPKWASQPETFGDILKKAIGGKNGC